MLPSMAGDCEQIKRHKASLSASQVLFPKLMKWG